MDKSRASQLRVLWIPRGYLQLKNIFIYFKKNLIYRLRLTRTRRTVPEAPPLVRMVEQPEGKSQIFIIEKKFELPNGNYF